MTPKTPSIRGVISRLARAEKKLDIDGLFIRIQSDGSGSVSTFDDSPVLLFATLNDLSAWLQKPRVIPYGDDGEVLVAASASCAAWQGDEGGPW
jgi:hypothetical protein